MVKSESIPGSDQFIMLDELTIVRENEFDRSYPSVQIVYPSNENSFCDTKIRESHPENGLTYRERRKYLFTISLNLDADY